MGIDLNTEDTETRRGIQREKQAREIWRNDKIKFWSGMLFSELHSVPLRELCGKPHSCQPGTGRRSTTEVTEEHRGKCGSVKAEEMTKAKLRFIADEVFRPDLKKSGYKLILAPGATIVNDINWNRPFEAIQQALQDAVVPPTSNE